MSNHPFRGWLVDMIVGGLFGGVLGLIAAANLVIYYGVERGYEASIGAIFAMSPILGLVVIGTLLAGTVLGIMTVHSRRMRKWLRRL